MKSRHFLARYEMPARFVLGGALNTVITYLVYLGLRTMVAYQWAFLVAYVLGIVFSYLFNARFVFRTRPRFASAISFPLIYLFQYAAAALLLEWLVTRLSFDERVAPLLVTCTVLPLTYLLTRFIFRVTSRPGN